jgi:hypothetical protein
MGGMNGIQMKWLTPGRIFFPYSVHGIPKAGWFDVHFCWE